MNTLTFFFAAGTVVSIAIYIWFHTDSGKAWLKSRASLFEKT